MISRKVAFSAATSVVLLSAGMVGLTPADAAPSDPVAKQPFRVHWNDGAPLAGRSAQAPGQAVKSYLADDAVGAAAGSLGSKGSWKARGLTVVRLGQQVGGLRVPATDVKAVFDGDGNLVSVIENTAKISGPAAAASASPAEALRAAVASLYPNRSVSSAGATTKANTTSYAGAGWRAAPTGETGALPTTSGEAAEGYVVTTWTTDNELNVTTVDGDGQVVDNESRTNTDRYSVFAEDPDESPQTTVNNPADGTASPAGWLAGLQWANHISGNNANAYRDADNDNKADPNLTAVTNGRFTTAWDGTVAPTTESNQKVAVQNLFYLNNTIHDVLYRAGFTEAAGNFQEDNFGRGGRASDAVQAEAQDGGGTDNANFATPTDGQNPRMQMYLWNQPETHEVVVGNSSFTGAGASWGAQLTPAGIAGQLAVANDGTGTTTDACEALGAVPSGAIVVADRGSCNFTVKAKNAQNAGAAGIVVANNIDGLPSAMGGEDSTVTIPGVMVSKADGATLKGLAGQSATIRLRDPAPLMKDASLDSDVVWHEYGHGLTWRMIGGMKGPLAGAIGEGMADVLAVIVNDDPFVGEYSASDPTGIRSASYEGYPGTYGDIIGTEVHADGELYGAIGWDLWKQYKAARLGRDAILADLVTGMNFTPAAPTYEEMRDGILNGLAASGRTDRQCMVWSSFARYGVGVGAVAKVSGNSVSVSETFAKPDGC